MRTLSLRLAAALPGLRGPRFWTVLIGLPVGGLLLAFVQAFLATFGASAPVVSGLLLALAATAALPVGRSPSTRTTARCWTAACACTLAVWTLALPGILWLTRGAFGFLSLEAVAHPIVSGLLSCLAAAGLLGLPVLAAVRLVPALERCWIDDGAAPETTVRNPVGPGAYVLALSAGALASATVFGPLLDLRALSLLAAAWLVVFTPPAMLVPSVRTAIEPRRTRNRVDWGNRLLVQAMALCLGGLVAGTARMVFELMPATLFAGCAVWAAVGLGLATTPARRVLPSFASACLLAAVWGTLLMAAFPWLGEGVAFVNAHVSQLPVLVGLRTLLLVLLFLPAGIAWTVVAGRARGPAFPPPGMTALLTGFLAGEALFPLIGVAPIVAGAASVLGLLAVGTSIPRRRQEPRLQWGLASVALGVAVAVPFLQFRFQPAVTARTLFSSSVMLARRTGLPSHLQPYVDEGRLLAAATGTGGTHTVWSHRGVQRQVRTAGVPRFVVSTDEAVCPQFGPEVLPAALPLVLHDAPRRVLVHGTGGGAALQTILAFPVMEVTCLEPDRALRRLLVESVWSGDPASPFEDERVRCVPVDGALASLCRGPAHDVLVSLPPHSSLGRSAACFSTEYYRRAAAGLGQHGVFCQRFSAADYGPKPLLAASRTLASAFQNTVAVTVGPGEFVLLGTNDPQGLKPDDFARRLQAPHVRSVLAGLGWDWTVPLNLAALDGPTLAELAGEHHAKPNTALNGRFACRLPLETMRWGEKLQELRTAFAGRAGRYVDWIDSEDAMLAAARLQDVMKARQIERDFPDEWWRYRHAVKQRIQSRPDSPITPVSHTADDGPRLHRDDRERLDYFVTLGEAFDRPVPGLDQLVEIEQAIRPFDPLITYFAHAELARLWSRVPDVGPTEELRHRLYLAYHADDANRSVRNVVAALELLAEHEQVTSGTARRWDHLNALLQQLLMRWNARGRVASLPARIVLRDIEASIDAVEAAYGVMERLAKSTPVATPEEWSQRRAFLDRSLVRPLRDYRARLLSHHVENRRQLQDVLDEGDADEREPEERGADSDAAKAPDPQDESADAS